MEEKILSASRIKTFQECSWKYWCNYVLKIPSPQNSGAARGTACHLILELLLKPKHKKYFDKILKENSIFGCPAVVKVVERSLKKDGGFDTEDNMKKCSAMIVVGLQYDFFGEDGLVESGEQAFLLESEDPKYKVLGFIDKPVQYPKNKSLKIVDYKSSKNKFVGEEITANIQAMVYTLAAKKLWPSLKDIVVEFLFLKFPRNPAMQIAVGEDQLTGFEYYLANVYEAINSFSEEDAKTNFASDHPFPNKDEGFKGPLMCGFAKEKGQLKKNGEIMWHCPYKFDVDYYGLVNEAGVVVSSAFNKKDLKSKDGHKIQKLHYEGCPAHRKTHTDDWLDGQVNDPKDDFDF